jgi:hypothetical protein
MESNLSSAKPCLPGLPARPPTCREAMRIPRDLLPESILSVYRAAAMILASVSPIVLGYRHLPQVRVLRSARCSVRLLVASAAH